MASLRWTVHGRHTNAQRDNGPDVILNLRGVSVSSNPAGDRNAALRAIRALIDVELGDRAPSAGAAAIREALEAGEISPYDPRTGLVGIDFAIERERAKHS